MSPGVKVALVPGVLALLPAYAGRIDPVAELRAACLSAIDWLGEDVCVVGDPQGVRVAESLRRSLGLAAPVEVISPSRGLDVRSSLALLAARPAEGEVGLPARPAGVLVVGNGSARRSEKAPGHLDERATAYDAELEKALRGGDVETLRGLDRGLAAELLVGNVDGLASLGDLLVPGAAAEVDYADDPYGVQYWVMRWSAPA